MKQQKTESMTTSPIGQVLGYLNFSSGGESLKVLGDGLNWIYAQLDSETPPADDTGGEESPDAVSQAERALDRLEQAVPEFAQSNPHFRDCDQAVAVLRLTRQLLAHYLEYHSDLLFQQDYATLYNPLALARFMQRVLRQGPPWNERERILSQATNELNEYLGYRPIATLNDGKKTEPYAHEWVAPIPLYIDDVGAAQGPYEPVIRQAIDFLFHADPDILHAAHFDPRQLKELCIDPRAYDFDHPSHKRPNHQFGQWDPDWISLDGFYQRFVVQQVTLDALMSRYTHPDEDDARLSPEERKVEAAAVLAGTILMASGICGQGPGAFDSETSLATLMPIVARLRDQFYRNLIDQLDPKHKKRLLAEEKTRQQPFGAARQHLNTTLARLRAQQLVNGRLATIFARMGYAEAAEKQARIVPAAASRILCQIDCRISTALLQIKQGELDSAFQHIPDIMALLRRGVECGAIVDPWNIIGFQANFSLFPHNLNSIPDHRAYELVELIERILGVCSQLWAEAAAADNLPMCQRIQVEFRNIVTWWHQFAAHQVADVDAVDPWSVYHAAEHVANSLNLWHKGGAAAGKIKFWSQHASMFDSAQAYALVIDSLLQRNDYQTSSALMFRWLDQADTIRLQVGDISFHDLAWRWISDQRKQLAQADDEQREAIWKQIRKFYDFLESNAGHYWQVPDFQVGPQRPESANSDLTTETVFGDEVGDHAEDTYDNAYENVIYIDSQDDGIDGSTFDYGMNSDSALEEEVNRVLDRLEFLATLAGYWRIAATSPLPLDRQLLADSPLRETLEQRREILSTWTNQAETNLADLKQLLTAVHNYPLDRSGIDMESMIQYDRQRLFRDSLVERIIASCVETQNAIRTLKAVVMAIDSLLNDQPLLAVEDDPISPYLIPSFAAIFLYDHEQLLPLIIELNMDLPRHSLLYVPLGRGGDPLAIVEAQVMQSILRDLLSSLPALGLLDQMFEVTRTTLAMERNHGIAQGAVTEFDQLFEVGYTAAVRCLIRSANAQKEARVARGNSEESAAQESQELLFDSIEMLTESMLLMWLSHSRTLRLSVLEKVDDKQEWEDLVHFIQSYGDQLFTQTFFNLPNLRTILHQGVDEWLDCAADDPEYESHPLFVALAESLVPRKQVVSHLTLILEAVVENFNEYRDYNATTTQSDQGELLYIFLDFLRLRSRYDRVCWNLKPIVWGHEMLVRSGQGNVARMWRRSLTERVGPEADKFQQRLQKLQTKYSVKMDTVARRLEERFISPMQIDRLRAIVGRAMEDPTSPSCQRTFEKLRNETQAFCHNTHAVGFDLPNWLAALENEVQRHLLPLRLRDRRDNSPLIEPLDSPIEALRDQLEDLPRGD